MSVRSCSNQTPNHAERNRRFSGASLICALIACRDPETLCNNPRKRLLRGFWVCDQPDNRRIRVLARAEKYENFLCTLPGVYIRLPLYTSPLNSTRSICRVVVLRGVRYCLISEARGCVVRVTVFSEGCYTVSQVLYLSLRVGSQKLNKLRCYVRGKTAIRRP